MKIREVKAHVLRSKLAEPFAYSRAWYDERWALIVEVISEDGLSGFGEVYGPARMNAPVVGIYGELLVGRDALATEAIWEDLYARFRDHGQKGLAIQALSGIDIALWDLKGKALGVPVHVLLGGPIRTHVQAYATGLYRRRRDDHETYLREEAAGYVAEGFSAVKLKVGFGLADDIASTRAVRREIGDGIAFMVDANHAYDTVSALAYGRAVADLDIGWFEEPVPPEDLDGYAALCAALPMPIAGGECEFTRFGFRELFRRRVLHIAQPDTCSAGGLSECKKIADMAAAFGIRYVPHCWGTGIAQAAALQLLAVLPHSPPGLFPVEPLLEMDRTEHPIRDAILQNPIRHRGGVVGVPEGPGLGIEIDRSALARFAA
ncbi:MAG TPA: mandelate racemase/muconate lactonizing enzyme family protein [Microvirga sp.]|jgi:D-galactarolactone cycloisomerase|nr:mandelate racemase/muconate lactonizing enzyme family protein [Microvirga sp.]